MVPSSGSRELPFRRSPLLRRIGGREVERDGRALTNADRLGSYELETVARSDLDEQDDGLGRRADSRGIQLPGVRRPGVQRIWIGGASGGDEGRDEEARE